MPCLFCAVVVLLLSQVWEFAGPGCINWQSADVGLPYMGCVVENRMLQAALLRAATAVSSGSSGSSGGGCLDMLCPASVKGLRLPGSSNAGTSSSSNQPLSQQLAAAGSSSAASSSSSSSSSSSLAELELADGSKLQCRLIVAADGARSRVRELAGFRTVGWSYNQRGLVATVATSEPNDTAWQRFLPTGPLALLPVRDGYSNVVWTVTPEMAKRLEAASSSEFAAAVNEALQQAPGGLGGSVSTGAAGAAASGPVAAAGAVLQGLGGALSSAPLVGQLLGGAVSSLGGAAAEAGSSGSSSSSSSWRAPPLVQGWAGTSPKSFPLQMQHSGR
jgi:ubiquinone biosynthesis monooxygenase Coq6